jgi:tetraacyldisaccharide 4'-kinase
MSRRGWLAPLSSIYGAAAGLKNAAYDQDWLRARRLGWPVISVGNLSVGGAGKTPVVIRLAELLAEGGNPVSVLSRGYGRESTAVEVVDPTGTAARYGDEPLLIARRAGSMVVVGADRFAAGSMAEELAGGASRGVHLLDDGFQHRRLARDLDVVVIHRSDFEERLLPAGRLREPLSALGRASVLVLREEDADIEGVLRRRGVATPVWWVRRRVSMPGGPERIVAFCGIARPGEFFDMLRGAGKTVLRERAFRDHHRYSSEDLEGLRRLAAECGADGFVTTEKDAVRLGDSLLTRLTGDGDVGAGTGFSPRAVVNPRLKVETWGTRLVSGRAIPLEVAELRATFVDEDAVMGGLLGVIESRLPR